MHACTCTCARSGIHMHVPTCPHAHVHSIGTSMLGCRGHARDRQARVSQRRRAATGTMAVKLTIVFQDPITIIAVVARNARKGNRECKNERKKKSKQAKGPPVIPLPASFYILEEVALNLYIVSPYRGA